jgi:putative acetyltransferase
VRKSLLSGLVIVGDDPDNEGEVIAEMHGYRHKLRVFSHVLTDVTVVVHPAYQGKKIGKTILSIFLNEIVHNHPEVGKIELITRESNVRAISLYQSVGFRIEGRLEMRIRSTDRRYEADIPMGWQNPNFEF